MRWSRGGRERRTAPSSLYVLSHNPQPIFLLKHTFKAGLFSAVVVVSIVESYKWLSPDSGSETVILLAQISRQLVNISNGIPLESIESSQPFKPTFSILMVNIMWFGSIVLCLAGSVFATLIQQSARRYQALTQGCPTPHERARLRAFLFNGIGKFKLDQLHQLLGMSMHVSILLYCIGLLIYIFTIETLLGFFALAYLLIFYLIYAIFTFTPIFFFDCPFGTPFTPLVWRLFHLCLLGFFSTTQRIVGRFHDWSKTCRNTSGSIKLANWLKTRVKTHRQWFLGGRQRSIEFYATVAPLAVDENTLERILAAFAEKDSEKELENFATWVPEFFDKYARSDPAKAISEEPSTNPIFSFRLRHLIKKCIPENSGLTEGLKRRLRVGLECLWHWVWAYNQNSKPLPPYFPLQVPSADMARRPRTEEDPIGGMIGRCFGALVAKKLAADLKSSHGPICDAKVEYLSTILGRAQTDVKSFLTNPDAIGHANIANIESLTSSEANTLVAERVPSNALKIFRTTVDILAEELTAPVAELGPPRSLILEAFIHSQALQAANHQWLLDTLKQILERLSVVRDAPTPVANDDLSSDKSEV
jgi:hypothetical protein